MSITELVVAVAVASTAAMITISFSMPWLARQSLRAALHDTIASVQLARIEAATRNQPVRFVVDTSTGSLEVWDTMATDGDISDDVRLHERRLPETVVFSRPNLGGVVTMELCEGAHRYHAIFASDGTVARGTGDVFLHGGERFGRVSIYAAGGSGIRYWNGAQWAPGT